MKGFNKDEFILTIKYWVQGEPWSEAKEYAKAMTAWTKNNKQRG